MMMTSLVLFRESESFHSINRHFANYRNGLISVPPRDRLITANVRSPLSIGTRRLHGEN